MIKISDLSYSYHEDEQSYQALNKINITIPKNKYTCILGHNGSGKSTLTKLLIGLINPMSGTIVIDGITLCDESIYDIRSKIGIVFQNPDNQFIGATVADDIAFGLENTCIEQSLMQDIIYNNAKKVNMEDFLNHEPSTLSGGQKQRVAIAGILAMNPQIMIFDEATTMLDPKGVLEVNQAIEDLKKSNEKTIISVTHDIEQAAKADYIIVLKDGSLLMEGSPQKIFEESNKLISTGLDIPFSLKVSYDLQNKGYSIPNCLDVKELKEGIWQLK